MISPDEKKTLMELADEVLHPTGLLETTFMQIEEILKKHPEEVAYFVGMFENEDYAEDRDILAVIIIGHLAHPGAIRFLRKENGWTDEDFKGTAAEGHVSKGPVRHP